MKLAKKGKTSHIINDINYYCMDALALFQSKTELKIQCKIQGGTERMLNNFPTKPTCFIKGIKCSMFYFLRNKYNKKSHKGLFLFPQTSKGL